MIKAPSSFLKQITMEIESKPTTGISFVNQFWFFRVYEKNCTNSDSERTKEHNKIRVTILCCQWEYYKCWQTGHPYL